MIIFLVAFVVAWVWVAKGCPGWWEILPGVIVGILVALALEIW